MDKLLWVAMSGAKENFHSLAVRSNNLANSATTGFKADFENFAEHYTNSSGDAIKKTWKAVERVFNRGKELWQDEDHGNIFEELMKN